MAELAIRFVRKMTHADWLPTHAIRFFIQTGKVWPEYFKTNLFEDKQTRFRYVLENIYYKNCQKRS